MMSRAVQVVSKACRKWQPVIFGGDPLSYAPACFSRRGYRYFDGRVMTMLMAEKQGTIARIKVSVERANGATKGSGSSGDLYQSDDEDPELLILVRSLGSLLLSHTAMATACQRTRMRR